MNETKPKKMVSRNVAVALGIICIILIAGMVEIWFYYLVQDIKKDETITELNNQIFRLNLENQNNQLQTWLNGNETLLRQTQANNTNLQNQIDSLNSNVTKLQNQMNNLTDILSLGKSTVWVDHQTVSQPTNSSTNWRFSASYAGCLFIDIEVPPIIVNGTIDIFTGIEEGIYVRVIYTFGTFGGQPPLVIYDNQVNLGGIGMTANFQVLPASIEIEVGNTKMIGNATETVTITYYY